jgi:hypothetical protein
MVDSFLNNGLLYKSFAAVWLSYGSQNLTKL